MLMIGGLMAVSPSAAAADVSYVRDFPVGGPAFALDGAGSIFVARAGAIDRYDTLGNPQTGFAVPADFGSPNDLTYSGGKLYAVDAGSNKLFRWDPSGANPLVSPDATEIFINMARSVVVSGNTAYVSGGETHRIARLSLFPTFGEFGLLFGWGVVPPGGDAGFQVCGAPGPCSSNGFSGPELGKINDARGLALDGAGNLYVSESAIGLSRVEVYNGSPAPVGAFGSQGTGSGQLREPGGIALDGSGNVFVADQHNHRVAQFRTDGTFVQAFGFGVKTGAAQLETCTTGCLPGIAGTAPGQLNFPYEVAVDDAGNVYVANVLGGRITVYGVPGSGSSPPPPGGTADSTPPATTIGKGPKKKTSKHKAKFTFSSDDPAATFQCKLDKKAFNACTSPKKVKVKPGKHKFLVEAIDAAGNTDASPAKFAWKVLKD